MITFLSYFLPFVPMIITVTSIYIELLILRYYRLVILFQYKPLYNSRFKLIQRGCRTFFSAASFLLY